jgi:hypothetical protein
VVGRFNAIARRQNIALEAWFNERREADRSWNVVEEEWSFPGRYIPRVNLAGKSVHLPVPELREQRPDVLVSLYSNPSFVLGTLAGQGVAKRHAFRVLPTYDTWVRRSPSRK